MNNCFLCGYSTVEFWKFIS